MLAITYESEDFRAQAEQLASQYQLKLIPFYQCGEYDGLIIVISSEYIGLIQGPAPLFKTKPFYIDFFAGKLAYRTKQIGVKKESLARAIGFKPKEDPYIVDATAGLGRDSFILAACGFRVTMLERSPILWLLMEDALKRAQAHTSLSPIIEKMTYLQTDALTWLKDNITPRPQVIYLDPMFPERKKSAAVKKEMVLLQQLVGDDPDAEQLLRLALSCASARVVVKRPRLAAAIGGIEPSFAITGKSSRFDIYLVNEK